MAAAQRPTNSKLIFQLFISSFYCKKAGNFVLNLQAYGLKRVKYSHSQIGGEIYVKRYVLSVSLTHKTKFKNNIGGAFS